MDEFEGRRAEPGGVEPDDVWAAEPVVSRVVAARVRDPSVVDDLVQDAMERLLRARNRVADELLVPFAVVIARNLVASYGRRTRSAQRVLEVSQGELDSPLAPDDVVVHEEERLALAAALRRLSDAERTRLVAHDMEGVPVAELSDEGVSASTMRVRLARSRAKLRVEYTLLRTGIELPSDRCRPTLLTLAGSDSGRQASAATSHHLLRCQACTELSDELVQRGRGVIVLVPLVALRWTLHAVRSHPVTAAAGTATAAAAAAGVVAVSASTPTAKPATPVSTPVAASAPVVPSTLPPLTINGQALAPTGNGSLVVLVGQTLVARAALVQSVVTHNGFWVGVSPIQRVWVELVGPLRSVQVTQGDHVSFVAPLVAQTSNYADQVVGAGDGAAQLAAQGAHVDVSTSGLTVLP